MKVKALVLSRHTFRYLARLLLLILWFSGLMVKAEALSEEQSFIYVADGAFIYYTEQSDETILKEEASVSDKHKVSSRHFRKKKLKEYGNHFRKGNSKTLTYNYRSGHPNRDTWGISGSNRWMGILCQNKISGYGILVALFFYDLLLLLAMMRLLLFFYSSLSLNKICIFFCCRPPPGKYIV
ncbi:hypothetical protein [Chryseobacterium taeanense]|uniref:hypothetical protein n=1 Tax=Chryseobacterium taeanense TaxID=311334 RepID=UPI0035ADED68